MVRNFLRQNRNVLLLVLVLILVGAIFVVRGRLAQPAAAVPAETPAQQAQPTESTDPAPEQTDPEPAGATEDPPAETPPEEPARVYDERAVALLESLTLREKVYQMFIVTPEGLTGVDGVTSAGETTRAALEASPVGGLVYFKSNITGSQQLTELIANSQSYAKIPLFISVDEEGGSVSRLGSNLALAETTRIGDMADYGAAGDAQAVYDAGVTIAGDLLHFGFNLNFAPVADVLTNPANTAIGPRAFSADPAVCAEMVSAFVKGTQDSGVIATLKHFPGHGGTTGDTHNGMVTLDASLEQLRAAEFVSFGAGIEAGAELVMVAHISATQLDGETPADLSEYIVTGLLRGELGFDGVVVTDSQSMAAITDYYTPAEAAIASVKAGVDIILMPADLQAAAEGIVKAVVDGELDVDTIDDSVLRILDLKYRYGILS